MDRKKLRIFLWMLLVSLLFFCGCSANRKTEYQKQYVKLSDFNGQTLGTLTGSTYEQLMAGIIPIHHGIIMMILQR